MRARIRTGLSAAFGRPGWVLSHENSNQSDEDERTERARPQSRAARSPNSTLRCAWQGSILIFFARQHRVTRFLSTCFGMGQTRCVPSDGVGVVGPRLAVQRTNAAKPFNFTFNLPAHHVQVTLSLRSVYVQFTFDLRLAEMAVFRRCVYV